MLIKPICISIVSHGQFKLMERLLFQLHKYSQLIEKVIITINIPEKIFKKKIYRSNLFSWTFNESPLGFGQNHNNAFKKCKSDYFCILNPDILIKKDTFSKLLFIKEKNNIGIIGPALINSSKNKQVNARKFPNFISSIYNFNKIKSEYFAWNTNKLRYTDWIGGMFMIIKVSDFKSLQGFDERFYLYYEDVDLCYRAKRKGLNIAECSEVIVVHDARRSSHRKLKYFLLHVRSFIKYFFKI